MESEKRDPVFCPATSVLGYDCWFPNGHAGEHYDGVRGRYWTATPPSVKGTPPTSAPLSPEERAEWKRRAKEVLRARYAYHANGGAVGAARELEAANAGLADYTTVSSPVANDSPLWLAWEAYIRTDEYANTLRWAPTHAEGSLWAAFERGFAARATPPSVEGTPPSGNREKQGRARAALDELASEAQALGLYPSPTPLPTAPAPPAGTGETPASVAKAFRDEIVSVWKMVAEKDEQLTRLRDVAKIAVNAWDARAPLTGSNALALVRNAEAAMSALRAELWPTVEEGGPPA